MVAKGYGGDKNSGEEQHEGPLEDGEDLHFDSVQRQHPGPDIVLYRFTRHHYWGKLGKRYRDLSV